MVALAFPPSAPQLHAYLPAPDGRLQSPFVTVPLGETGAVEHFQAAFESLPTGALLVDGSGHIMACNRAAAASIAIPAAALVGRLWLSLVRPDSGDAILAPGVRRHAIVRSGAGERPVSLHTIPLDAGDTGAPVLVLLDADGAETRGGVDGPCLADVAHELRSPLLSFNLALGSLADVVVAAGDRQAERLIAVLQRSLVHLQTLIENMLDVSSIETQAFSVTLAQTDLAWVVDEATHVVAPLLEPNNQRVHVDIPTVPMLVKADAQRLRQVLVNLLHNAIKYGACNDTIFVSACATAEGVTVEIADAGPGIPLDEQPHLFERYFRGRTARESAPGSGLGLAIAREIVRAHGGEIGVYSAPSKGTRVWFTLHRA